ncbi:hypothetical protein [Spiroplasma endosymbiont of Megaselia nigra]|uniref:hypothetical protein n=1 Tax=Spiroplasma endosymbiont of Megaselia nigra TaxID=2478537 RepID=UPI000F86DE8E|nr:hypothetical protein [Spiroplasma endosymbiont of Megaselia nigra]RUO85727.1 hypothetical protein D9R21_07080 [Spiroplasma endosymbiont of Megaselia nigra]
MGSSVKPYLLLETFKNFDQSVLSSFYVKNYNYNFIASIHVDGLCIARKDGVEVNIKFLHIERKRIS